ncbi:hypothetical protein GGQ76_000441 [Aureimonas jatrophae]|uniref:NAD(P)-binding domain-containing protein n=2 Tax=Aureimonas jatrophae TaxID=1166073 RepID=A0A1H0CCE6_9HYPH|nr:NAD(P)-dependent oxidoreductase [Aureimonas jatrophae]MBB3949173.1 hypothetical protein [Aureimonas jatrophae]SDN55568.1 hypothetical protein SAMN05192530_101245 [Aureimonas jatrophae]
MKVALIGASGQAGSRILRELSSRGHETTAIARNPERIDAGPGVTAVRGDVAEGEALAAILRGHDAVVSSVHFLAFDPETLVAAVRASEVKRYLVVGGAGSLEVASGQRLLDAPDFPDAYKAEATAGAAYLDRLRALDDLDWTFFSPAAMFVPGERTGRFRLGQDMLIANDEGSSISFEDYAVALVDELEQPRHVRGRFTIGY